MSKQSHLNQHSLLQFDPIIGPYQMLPLRARVDLGAMVMNELYYYWNHTIRWISVISRTLVGGGLLLLSRAEQSVYSTAPTDWVKCFFGLSNFNKFAIILEGYDHFISKFHYNIKTCANNNFPKGVKFKSMRKYLNFKSNNRIENYLHLRTKHVRYFPVALLWFYGISTIVDYLMPN